MRIPRRRRKGSGFPLAKTAVGGSSLLAVAGLVYYFVGIDKIRAAGGRVRDRVRGRKSAT